MSGLESEKAFDPLELLNRAEQSEDLRKNISTAALLWAGASIVAVIMNYTGRVTSYRDALPVIVLVAWLGTEAIARIPSRIPISICSQCGRTIILPRKSFRRLWPWKHCTYCGGALRYSCPKGHLFSLFSDDPLVIEIQLKGHEAPMTMSALWCSRCGDRSKGITAEAAKEYWHLLFTQSSKSGNFYADMLEILMTSQGHPKTEGDFFAVFEGFLKVAPDQVKRFDLLERVLNFGNLRPTESGGLRTVLTSAVTREDFLAVYKRLLEHAPFETDGVDLINLILHTNPAVDPTYELKSITNVLSNRNLLASVVERSLGEFARIAAIPPFEIGPCPSCFNELAFPRCSTCDDNSWPLSQKGWCLNCDSLCEQFRCVRCGKASARDAWCLNDQTTLNDS